MAIITASIIDQHLYFGMNAPLGLTGGTPEKAAAYTNTLGLSGPPATPELFADAAADVGEKSIISRTGGAPTLAVGISEVFHKFLGGESMKAFWYHFAIMFEALFILTTIDAGTRVARFLVSDALGNFGGGFRKFRDPSWRVGAWLCSLLVVAGWGSVLLMGVNDPFGGINALYPLFGIANQLLAAIALTVVLTIIIKRGLLKWAWIPGVPLVWDLLVTMTASWQKIFSADPKLGYWKQHSLCQAAKEAGTGCLTAKTPEQVDIAIRNTFIQGTLSIVFAVLVLIVTVVGAIVCARAVRSGTVSSTESEEQPSKIFAPSGFVSTAAEKDVQKEWDALIAEGKVTAPGSAHVS